MITLDDEPLTCGLGMKETMAFETLFDDCLFPWKTSDINSHSHPWSEQARSCSLPSSLELPNVSSALHTKPSLLNDPLHSTPKLPALCHPLHRCLFRTVPSVPMPFSHTWMCPPWQCLGTFDMPCPMTCRIVLSFLLSG